MVRTWTAALVAALVVAGGAAPAATAAAVAQPPLFTSERLYRYGPTGVDVCRAVPVATLSRLLRARVTKVQRGPSSSCVVSTARRVRHGQTAHVGFGLLTPNSPVVNGGQPRHDYPDDRPLPGAGPRGHHSVSPLLGDTLAVAGQGTAGAFAAVFSGSSAEQASVARAVVNLVVAYGRPRMKAVAAPAMLQPPEQFRAAAGDPRGTVSGVVRSGCTRPEPGAGVTLTRQLPGSHGYVWDQRLSGAGGSVTFPRVPAGSYRLRIVHPVLRPGVGWVTSAEVKVVAGRTTTLPAGAGCASPAPPAVARAGALSIGVRDSRGSLVPGVEVAVSPSEAQHPASEPTASRPPADAQRSTTGATGTVTFGGLAPGWYAVHVLGGPGVTAGLRGTVLVSEGATRDVVYAGTY